MSAGLSTLYSSDPDNLMFGKGIYFSDSLCKSHRYGTGKCGSLTSFAALRRSAQVDTNRIAPICAPAAAREEAS